MFLRAVQLWRVLLVVLRYVLLFRFHGAKHSSLELSGRAQFLKCHQSLGYSQCRLQSRFRELCVVNPAKVL